VNRHKISLILASAIAVAAGSAQAADMKIGVFDFQRVSEETARGQELRASLEKFGDKKKAEITAKESELKALEDKYKAEAFSLTPDKRSQMEKDLQKRQLELQSFRENAQKEMQIEVNEAQGKFNEQLLTIITALGKERAYTLVFAKEQVAFASDGADMTSELIERFNQETAKAPAAAAAPAAAKPLPAAAKPAAGVDDKKPATPPAAPPKKP